MKLYASPSSPFARKIHVMLVEKALAFEVVTASPWEPDSPLPDLNPLGKVPVLVADDGEAFYDSPVIAAWIETRPALPRLVPADPLEAVRVRQLEALSDGIAEAALSIVLEGRRPAELRSDEEIGRQLQKIELGLNRLEHLVTGHTWLHGDHISLADIATGTTLAYLDLRLPHLGWRTTRPELTVFAQRLFERPSFIATAPRVN